MKITENKDVKLLVADIETLSCMLDFGFYNPDTGEWHEFEISKFKNDLYAFVKFYNKSNWDYITYFNGVDFDAQVIQYILDNYLNWWNLSSLEICEKVYEFVQKIIDDKKYGVFSTYREHQFEIPVIDVFTILGLNNEARWTS